MAPQDTDAWITAVLDRYERALIAYAAALLRDPDEARDVVQETFLRLSREDYVALEPRLAPWLFSVCRNLCLDQLRRSKRLLSMDGLVVHEAVSPEPSPDDAAMHSDTRETLEELLRALPGKEREVVRLKFEADLSYREISEVTNLKVGHVGFLLHTALQRLRARWPRESSSVL